MEEKYLPKHKIRFVTAASLFDGHDASINIMRRILQSSGAEVIHLGHNRSVEEVVEAAIQEDVQGIAVSSYQGGHMEYFKYMVDLLRKRGAGEINVFGGGGGVIIPAEIKELEEYGVAKIFSPEDGRILGLQGMINHMLRLCDFSPLKRWEESPERLRRGDTLELAKWITLAEMAVEEEGARERLRLLPDEERKIPVIGITGTGGAGKSSLTDELIARFLAYDEKVKIAVLSVDPSKQKTGGALLGDRIRMNSIDHPRVFFRSLATRGAKSELSLAIQDAVKVVKTAPFTLIFVETSGIGQGDTEIARISDLSLYVMTSEYGAPSQLEKIDMLDYADLVVINKFDHKGAEDAMRDVRKEIRRNRNLLSASLEELPVYGTVASRFNDPGVNRLFQALIGKMNEKLNENWPLPSERNEVREENAGVIPPERRGYLREIAETVRNYKKKTKEQAKIASRLYQVQGVISLLENGRGEGPERLKFESVDREEGETPEPLSLLYSKRRELKNLLLPGVKQDLRNWEERLSGYKEKWSLSLSGTRIPKIALPRYTDWGDRVRWIREENFPGHFPFTAGVFPFKREEEEPTRMFAGEGTPERTNRRFHYLSQNSKAKRLSTAFDSVTLYGEDPDRRPDIYGKIGTSGVSVATLDDMKKLYAGFDLADPLTSVSMTINGPAPILLAMYFNTAIDQQVEKFEKEAGRRATPAEYEEIKKATLQRVRGTVQADILKEDQGQNTCIFSTEFALKMMGDIQEYFIQHQVKNYYSVSISGYHIAEAGANPITQLAFTLANGFTYVEYYLKRGMKIDDFAPNLSFFFSNGLDPEYAVIGRVARRIWAIAMKEKYGANERSQKLKYHIQTSGRSLHAQEMDFNDIRTTIQALLAIYDNCNSLHTNAYDEAVTTPTEESVRRALAIQLILQREFGMTKNENPLQGAFIIEELTDLVEEAVLREFERLDERGGVLGAMERMYQRGKIQEESLLYEMKKHSGELPIIGVNTFLNPHSALEKVDALELARATEEEKEEQIQNLQAFKERHRKESEKALSRLKEVALKGGNIFAELMETVKVASLGQITKALYEVGGKYRRNM
ncbi:Methylmalonyl-CoA mutase, large subunit [[Clostridium] ultunense Esp]|nr:Methylmalonyl-CoA mutase, large subunit [[Clostridium] ultunense Esp]